MENKIYHVVLTGGPCGGKTTALQSVSHHFSQMGYQVFSLPEVPTLFSEAGVDFLTSDKRLFKAMEVAVLRMQQFLEDQFAFISCHTDKPALIISDRGLLDVKAYLSEIQWLEILEELAVTEQELASRYDVVVHLVTAADGAEAFYTLENNLHRTEGPELARQLDRKLIQAWTNHARHCVIDNSTGFEKKIEKVIQAIEAVI